jgi:hypothetical protein
MKQEVLDYNFVRHCPNEDQIERYDSIRRKIKRAAELISEICPEGREKDQAIINLEQSMFWANASISREDSC